MNYAIPVASLVIAGFLQLAGWWQGRFNVGPRVGSILLLVFGQIAFVGNQVGVWLREGLDWFERTLGTLVGYLFGDAVGDGVGAVFPNLFVALFCLFWLAAWLPKLFSERMDWHTAWVGVLIPPFIAAISGPVGDVLTVVFGWITTVGITVVGWLFAWSN